MLVIFFNDSLPDELLSHIKMPGLNASEQVTDFILS